MASWPHHSLTLYVPLLQCGENSDRPVDATVLPYHSGQAFYHLVLRPPAGPMRISPVSEMTYTVSSRTLNPSIPYHTHKPLYCTLAVRFWSATTKGCRHTGHRHKMWTWVSCLRQLNYCLEKTRMPSTLWCCWLGGNHTSL